MLRAVLRRHLPDGTFVGTGFIVGRERHSSQIDLLVLRQSKPMLFHEGDVAIVAAEAPAVIVEVKTGLVGLEAWREALRKLANNGALCRDIAENRVWLGLFAYEGDEGQVNNVLDALRDVRRETRIPINCVCAGHSIFVRYWPAGQAEHGDDPADRDRSYWRAYDLPQLAPSYFISNLIDGVCDLDRDGTDYVWFAHERGKRHALLAQRAAD